MNKPIVNKPGSLLERAAEVYDFSAHFRVPIIPEDDLPPPPPMEPVPAASSVPPVAAPVAVARVAPPVPVRTAAIDRTLLADNGLLVPGAAIGVLAEEFRLAKRQLLLSARRLAVSDPARARTILVCSPQPGDGKTYCAVNLAISMAAERDLRVLLVDADFAKPGVMERLGIEDGPGLLDALGDPSIDVESCVVGTDIANLSVLPAGASSTADTELIASDRTPDLIARLLAADPERLVIFDSPPALAASPASVLALHVGQLMLVVRADSTTEGDIRDAVQRLDGCENIQLLLNSVSFAPDGARFGTYYGQGDGQ